ncbi:uncharacterized protein H6S33_012429 [Morchella sextelata]|uniref:uncharacterized protein n=1 Tax=Morchella sextelata TaxID=1174677 RepID=UPI001D0565CE|nr:uncharacterized protein H6S33_012429 [Morchella sextelata]KAH0609883.1 hypothetical protein H6S33_012429 [Morchella sextelata]
MVDTYEMAAIATVFLKRVALFPRRLVVIIERSTCQRPRDGVAPSQEKERDQKQPVRTCSRSAPSSPRSKPKPIFRFHTPYNLFISVPPEVGTLSVSQSVAMTSDQKRDVFWKHLGFFNFRARGSPTPHCLRMIQFVRSDGHQPSRVPVTLIVEPWNSASKQDMVWHPDMEHRFFHERPFNIGTLQFSSKALFAASSIIPSKVTKPHLYPRQAKPRIMFPIVRWG